MKKIFSTVIAAALAAFTFTSCEDVPMPYDMPGTGGGQTVTIEPEGEGTFESPYNIAKVLEVAGALESGANSASKVYFRGKVVSVKECSAQYGNATFYLSDDGSSKKQFYVYRCNGLNNGKVTSDDMVQPGMEIVVYGTLTNYQGTLETAQKEAYIVSINGEGGSAPETGNDANIEAKGAGTEADPFNVAAAIAKCKATGETATTEVYYVKGIAKTIDASGAAQYGNITIDMVDNGGSAIFKAFQIVSIGGAKFTEASVATTVKEGDEIVVKGNLVNYKGNTPETTGKGAGQLVSVNGKAEGSGDQGGDNNPPTTGTSEGISIDNTTVTLTATGVTAGTETVELVVNDLKIEDKASAIGTYTLADGTTLTVATGDGKSGPTYYAASNGFRIYASNTLSFEAKKTIASIVFECDAYNDTKYVGNTTATVSFDGNKAVYCNKNEANSGGTQLRVKKIIITYAK